VGGLVGELLRIEQNRGVFTAEFGYTSGNNTNLFGRSFRGIVELLKQCVKVHHVGGNLTVDGIDITVEPKQRVLKGLSRYSRPAASFGAPGVSPTGVHPRVAPQQTPGVSPVRSASPLASQYLFSAPPAEIEPVVQEALKLALHQALGDPGVRPALPRAFEHARRIPSDRFTREQALHVAFRQVPAAPPIVQQTPNPSDISYSIHPLFNRIPQHLLVNRVHKHPAALLTTCRVDRRQRRNESWN